MAESGYLNFDLCIERSGTGYRAQVLDSPGGTGWAEFSLPFSHLELENFLLRLGRPGRGVRRVESPEIETAKAFGGKLFTTIFDDEVRGCLRGSLNEAARQGLGLRVRLRLTDAPELAGLPWEYLYDPGLNRFLSLSSVTPVVRYLDLPETIRPLTVVPPIKVLVVIASPTDYPPLDAEREWTNLKNAFSDLEGSGQVALERLDQATLAALRPRLRQGRHQVLHFIGHGAFDEAAGGHVLVMEDQDGHGRRVSGQDLGMVLHGLGSLRLAVLNACEGGRADPTDPFAGTAQSLVQQGIPAVIAMQFEISDQAAITFAHEFYRAVADGSPVDAAVADARIAVFTQGYGVEWGTPVVFLRAPDGRIFDTASPPTAAPARARSDASGPAVVAVPPEKPLPLTGPTESPAPRKARLPRPALVGGVLALLLLVVGAWVLRPRGPGPAPSAGEPINVPADTPIASPTRAMAAAPTIAPTSAVAPTGGAPAAGGRPLPAPRNAAETLVGQRATGCTYNVDFEIGVARVEWTKTVTGHAAPGNGMWVVAIVNVTNLGTKDASLTTYPVMLQDGRGRQFQVKEYPPDRVDLARAYGVKGTFEYFTPGITEQSVLTFQVPEDVGPLTLVGTRSFCLP